MGRNREFNHEEVLDRAMIVFWQRGYTAASMTEMCQEMSLNPGSIYNAFGNKHGLFIAVVKKYFADIAAPGVDVIENSASGVEGIQKYFEMIAQGILNGHRHWGCLGTNAFIELSEQDSEVALVMSNHLADLEHSFYKALTKDNIEDAEERAKFLICMSQGLNVIAKTSPSAKTLDAMIEHTMSVLNTPEVA